MSKDLIGKNIYASQSQTVSKNPTYTNLRCLMPGVYKITGIPTRTEYIFTNGSIQAVKDEDVKDLLSKTVKQGCCGNERGYKNLFEVV